MARGYFDILSNHAVSVGVTATHLTTARVPTERNAVLVQNTSTDVLYIGGSTVTTANGVRLGQNEHIVIEGGVALYGISAGTSNVRVIEFQ